MPYLYQSILVWGHDSGRVFKLQKRANRLIFKEKYNVHTDKLFKTISIPKYPDIYQLSALKFYHKYMNDQLPVYFPNMFTPIRDQHNYNTRNSISLNRSLGNFIPKNVFAILFQKLLQIYLHVFTPN